MKFYISKNKKQGDKKAFEIIKKQALKKPDSLIALAAGKTTDGLHKLISNDAKKYPKKWKKIKILQIDENLGIPPHSLFSFNNEIRKELSPLLKILNAKNVFLIDGRKNPNKTINEAYKFIKQNKGIDLITLGIGPEYDPHIAYNVSSKSSLKSKMRVVKLHPETLKRMVRATGRSPQLGITLGIRDILDTKKALLMVYGKEKAKSMYLAFGKKKVNINRASASALLQHKNLSVVLDKNATKYSCKGNS